MNKRQKEVIKYSFEAEKKTLKELIQIYNQAREDCEKRILQLSKRADMEDVEHLQSIIYQKKYQEAIKKQLDSICDKLNEKQFETISEYIEECYINGFSGVLYDLQGQGIPLVMPINQAQVTEAIQLDSKISKGLYTYMGEDVKHLKTSIRAELSRGISQGRMWEDVASHIAKGMNSPFNRSYNRAILITRTEGHRVQQKSALDAQYAAKNAGADIVKQWDSTLDSRTRDSHKILDGQIRELDEDFEVLGHSAKAPGYFGLPSEDCNCRCCLLQRAKWALNEDELQTLKEHAEYFELDKSESFENFKQKFLDIVDIPTSSESSPSTNLVRSVEEFTKVTEDVREDINQYVTNPSKWSGKININNSLAADNIFGQKNWSCDITVIDIASDGVIWHEMLHSCSASYYSPDVYVANKHIEEATVEFLKVQICKEKGIKDVVAYPDTVNILQVLNDNFDFGTDMDFAQKLFAIPLPDRYQWLENQVDQKLRDANVSFEDYNDVMGYLQNLRGGDE